jgi:hypothetical protein
MRRLERLLRLDASLHVGVCDVHEFSQGHILDFLAGSELDVPHEPAGAFQQSVCIGELGTTKEPDIHVIPERIDVAECGISNARRWMTVVQ